MLRPISHAAQALLLAAGAQATSVASPASLEQVDDYRDARGAKKGGVRKDLTMDQKNAWLKELLRAKDAAVARDGLKRGQWLREFVQSTWPCTKRDKSGFGQRRSLCYRLLQAQRGKQEEPELAPSGPCDATKPSSALYYAQISTVDQYKSRGPARAGKLPPVRKTIRKRNHQGRQQLCPEIGFELWTWFVDTVRNVRSRIGNSILQAQAEKLKIDIQDASDDLIRDGRMTENQRPKLPKINASWIQSWRKRYRVSHKTTTIVYKVSRAKLVMRLGVFWRNCIRIRYFHKRMFPNGKLRCRSYDQKPLYFNQAGDTGTLASMDEREVEVRENCHATRARFTVMTKSVSKELDESGEDVKARSHNTGDPNSLAVLFKAAGTGERIAQALQVPEKTLVQFGPKGSYRTEQVLAFLKWDLGVADGNGDLELVFLDWFSAHLADEVRDYIVEEGHVPLYIPGGATPWVATLDTHAHAPYQREYLSAEEADNLAQMLAGAAMPACDRQTVLTRASDTWGLVDHDKLGETAWIHDGVLLPLDGSGDHNLRHQCEPFWRELGMSAVRDRILASIDVSIRHGDLTRWSQWPELLEPYDNHPGQVEGEETGRERIGDPSDDEDDGEDGCDLVQEDAGDEDEDAEDHEGNHGGSDDDLDGGAPAAVNSSGSSGSHVKSARSPWDATVSGHPATRDLHVLLAAQQTMQESKLNDPQLAKVLSHRIREVGKRAASTTNPHVVAALREQGQQRRDDLAQRRQGARNARQESMDLDLKVKRAKLEYDAAKVKSVAEAAIAKARLAEVEKEKVQLALTAKDLKTKQRLIRLHYATVLYNRLLHFTELDKKKNRHKLEELKVLTTQQAKREAGAKTMIPPPFMDATRNSILLIKFNYDATEFVFLASLLGLALLTSLSDDGTVFLCFPQSAFPRREHVLGEPRGSA